MTRIHPSAVIDPTAEIGEDVEVGPFCVVEAGVRIGDRCVLHPHVTVMGDTTLGTDNHVFSGAVIGAEPQDLKHDGQSVKLVIGDDNRFREHVTVHPGTTAGGGITQVGSGGLFMVGCHIAHDCSVGDRVILANHVLLAGHVHVGDGAILNGASACHHFTTIGRLAYVGGLSSLTQDVHPFTVVEGHPGRTRGANTVGMHRAGIEAERIQIVKRAVFAIFLSEKESSTQALARLEREHPDEPLIEELIASVRASAAGRKGRSAEPVGRGS